MSAILEEIIRREAYGIASRVEVLAGIEMVRMEERIKSLKMERALLKREILNMVEHNRIEQEAIRQEREDERRWGA
jgi:hypothetical protein